MAFDVIAEAIGLDDTPLKERSDTLLKIQELETYKMFDIRQKARCKWILEGGRELKVFPWYHQHDHIESSNKWLKHQRGVDYQSKKHKK